MWAKPWVTLRSPCKGGCAVTGCEEEPGHWQRNNSLAEEQLGISITERRRSLGLPLPVLAPCLTVFPVSGTLGYPRGAPCPSWLIGALSLQSPRLKLLECTRIKVALGFSWDLSCLVSQS